MEQLNENSSIEERDYEKGSSKTKFTVLETIKENKKIVMVVLSLIIAIISFAFVSEYASSAKIHSETITVLQEKQDRVLQLSAASTGIAAGASLALGDRAVSVSNKLLDLTGYFIIILSAILLEKYLVTVMGLVAFKYLIPIACIIFSVFTIIDNRGMRKLAIRLAVFAMVIFLIIPISVGISNVIENTYETSINSTLESSKMVEEELKEIGDESDKVIDNINESVNENIESDDLISSMGRWFSDAKDTIVGAVKNAANVVTKKAKEMISKLTTQLNKMIDAIAIMIVTTCIIPILVIIFFLWVVKLLFEININFDVTKAPKLSKIK